MKTLLFTLIITASLFVLPQYGEAQTKQVENLDRGLIAITQNDGFLLSWRLLGNEAYDTGFNIYRDDVKINAEPLTGATIFMDEEAPANPVYTVRAVTNEGEQPASKPARILNQLQGENAAYFDIPLNKPQDGPEGGSYSPNDLSAADLTGNGEYEIVVKWDPSNAKDNSQQGTTDNVILDAYTLDGAMLWRINLGPNIRAGAHYTQFMVYDFDGNGKAEVMLKTAPGTKDGSGGFLSKGPASSADHQTDYRNGSGYILDGPEYLTVFDGETGLELATTDYVPARGNVNDWGDNYGNRVDRFLAGVAYVDGEKPTAIFARGYYTRMVVAAWDWRDGQLTQRWVFDTNDSAYNNQWEGQGNHQLSIADADNDGRHEIIYGSVVIDDDGSGLHTTGLGHGDALHVAHMIKGDPIPKIFMPHEWDVPGLSLRNANDGSMLFQLNHSGDVGRGVAAEIDSEVPGFKMWASSGLGMYDLDGNVVGNIPNSINHVIWWDGELSRELLNSNVISKWSVAQNSGTNLLVGEGASSINGTKANPNLQADILGDWREEVIFRTIDNNSLRVYTTTMPTQHRIYTLMHDPVYRTAIAWQNTAYNQPPHPGFYMASDMDFPLSQPDVVFAQSDLSGCSISPIDPYLKIGEGELLATSNAYVEIGNNVTLSPQAENGGTWNWTGPGSFTASEREVTIQNIQVAQLGDYIVSYTNDCGSQSSYTFTITQEPEVSEVIFAVDMEGQDTSNGVYLTGDIVDWNIVSMNHEANNIYSYYADADPGDEGAYYYMTTNTWDNYQNFRESVPSECADWYGTDRGYVIGEEAMTLAYKWGTCQSFDFDLATPIETGPEQPEEFELSQNYPNPFNPNTIISYQLPVQSTVQLTVYDLTGRKVAVLVDGEVKTAGTYSVPFNAAHLASGMYIYRIQAGDFIQTKKLLLIK